MKGVHSVEWNFEDGLNLKFDNDFFGWENYLYLFFTYFKPINSSRADLDNDTDCFDNLLNQMANVGEDGSILISGDLNSRVSNNQECNINCNENDHLLQLLPLLMFENAFSSSDFIDNNISIDRTNQDACINEYGRKLISLCYRIVI